MSFVYLLNEIDTIFSQSLQLEFNILSFIALDVLSCSRYHGLNCMLLKGKLSFLQLLSFLCSRPTICHQNRRHVTEIILHASPLQSNGGRTQKIWFKFLAKCYRTTLCASVARHWVWATSLKIFQPTVKCDNPDQFGIGRIGGLYLEIPKKQSTLPLLSSNWVSTFSLCHCLSVQQIKTGN